MKTLTIVRHAKSSWSDPSLADFDRPLNHRGRSNAPEMGRRLADRGLGFDRIVTSPARRARKTAGLIAREVGYQRAEIREDAAIYEADVSELVELVRALDDEDEAVMIVGHNPGFADLSFFLTGKHFGKFPTCAILHLELDEPHWRDVKEGAARTLFYDFPKNPGFREDSARIR